MLAKAQQTIRPAALGLMGSAAVSGVLMLLVAVASLVGAVALVASAGGSPGPDATVGAVLLSINAAIHGGIAVGQLFVGYGALRMLRTHGFGWAVAAPIVHMAIALIHGGILFMMANVFACLVVIPEVGLALPAGVFAMTRVFDPSVRRAFAAVERNPDLMEVTRYGEA